MKNRSHPAALEAYERLIRTGIPLDCCPREAASVLSLRVCGPSTVHFISSFRNYIFAVEFVNPSSRAMRVDNFDLSLAPWDEPNFYLLPAAASPVNFYNLPLLGRRWKLDRSQVLNEYLDGTKSLAPKTVISGAFLAEGRGTLTQALRPGQLYLCNVSLTDQLGLSATCQLQIQAKAGRLPQRPERRHSQLWADPDCPARELNAANHPDHEVDPGRSDADNTQRRNTIH